MDWKKHPQTVLVGLLLLHLLAHIDRNMLMGFSPQIIADLHLSNAQYGFLVGAVWVLSFGVMAMFMGSLADRFSRSRVIACGLMIWSVCTWASGHAQSLEQMVMARFFVASGEAALVPAAAALLGELFAARRLGAAVGVFFMGIPLGIGASFLLAGTVGASVGWRMTFDALGVVGMALAVPVFFLKDERGSRMQQVRGAPFVQQVKAVWRQVGSSPILRHTIIGFVLIHLTFAGLAFTQLWLVGERGMPSAGIATRIGGLQLLFGTLGSLAGGVLGDRIATRFKGGHATFMVLLVLLCTPLMIAFHLGPAGTPLFYIGMCASFFLPLAMYGPANNILISHSPEQMRSTMSGFTMLAINFFAIALGNLTFGAASDALRAAGHAAPLTTMLLLTDLLVFAAVPFLYLASRTLAQRALPVAQAC